MKNSNKPDLEEATNVRVAHRDVDREAAAAAREMTVRENGLEPVSTVAIISFVLISALAGGVLFKDSLFNYGDHPEGYRRAPDPNAVVKAPTTDEAFKVYYGLGQQKFAVCASCHGSNGEGSAQAPPLAGSQWAQESNVHLLTIASRGVKGPIKVKGKEWNAVMSPMAASFSDFELASLATFVSNGFGKGTQEMVSIEQIQDLKKRITAWEADGGEGQVTATELVSKPYFQGELEGTALKPTDIVNKKTGLPE